MNRQEQWIIPPKNMSLKGPFVRGRMLRPLGDHSFEFELHTDRGPCKVTIPVDFSFDAGQG
jgi:hypothetical protein